MRMRKYKKSHIVECDKHLAQVLAVNADGTCVVRELDDTEKVVPMVQLSGVTLSTSLLLAIGFLVAEHPYYETPCLKLYNVRKEEKNKTEFPDDDWVPPSIALLKSEGEESFFVYMRAPKEGWMRGNNCITQLHELQDYFQLEGYALAPSPDRLLLEVGKSRIIA